MEKNIVIIGAEDTGKTTLANALLGWDVFPQSYEYVYVPTRAVDSRMLTDTLRLTDTPGYSLLWNTVPEDTATAVSSADTLVVLLSEEMTEEWEIEEMDPFWEDRRGCEARLLTDLLAGKTRDIYFVIPYDKGEWPEGQVPLSQALTWARTRFSHFSDHGGDGFYCIDPMEALLGEIQADEAQITASGIRPLKAALLEAHRKDV